MLRLIFMGTPDFAVPTLEKIVACGHAVAAVYTRAPKPAGARGLELTPSPVERAARRLVLDVLTPARMRDTAVGQAFAAHQADAVVVVAYGLILPPPILATTRLGCFNVHASLLPRWRGAAPIQRALLANDAVTGITIMQMEEGLDTGPIWMQEALPIGSDATATTLSTELAVLGGRLMLAALDGVAEGALKPRAQPEEGVTYAQKLRREEGRLDWRLPSTDLERRVRALDPWPGAFFDSGSERIQVQAAIALPGPAGGVPGTVLDDRLSIACGEGVLRPLRLQRPGRASLEAQAFLRGLPIPPGTVLPCPATS